MPTGDLLDLAVAPVRQSVEAMLGAQAPLAVVGGTTALLDATVLAIVGLVLAGAGRVLAGEPIATGRETPRSGGTMLRLATGTAAALLLAWIATHPSPQAHQLFARGDHLAFATLVGSLLVRTPPGPRAWLVAALSIAFLCQYSGPAAVAICLVAGLVTYGALQVPAGRRPAVAVLVHAAVGVAVYALCWRLRARDFLTSAYVIGLFVFFFLRQISFAASACQGRGGDLGSYLCYLLFYPGATGAFGGPEVWSEFSRRNLGGRAGADHARAARSVVRGAVEVWVSERIPMSADVVFASPTPALAWLNSFLLLFKVVLLGMGFWALIDATASFYGFRLRPNFEGILRARNPSELWRSWRGTLTNWLVTHVYAPLGANRRHQSLNILAAFGVSLVWHWAGVPFMDADFSPGDLAPITLWAAVNAIAVVLHVQATRHGWRVLPASTPPRLRQAIHVFGTLCLATLSVTLPSAQLGAQAELVPFVRCLLGVCR